MPERLGIRDQIAAFKELSAPERKKRPGQKTPLFIICAEGGGVRAAYWAARLLAYLEDTTRHYPEQYVPFSSRVLAISGVSGGSLGAATFTALLDGYAADTANRGDWFFNRTANFLGRDQLSAPLASAAFIDTTQRFIPYPIFDQRDRAAGLERAWENAWGESLKYADGNISRFCRFDDDFRKLWRHRDTAAAARGEGSSTQWIPSLFFNSTAVELGGRIIASDCQIPAGDYPGAQDAFSLLRLRDSEVAKSERDLFRLSSAVNLSTRFPGISPSGELPAGNSQFPQRVVDGGYYDNSGARTAWDNLVVVYYDLLNSVHSPAEASDVIPWVIVIRAGPRTKRQAPSVTSEVPSGWNFLPPQARPVPRHFMVDVLAPARAFLNAWGARSADSIEALRDGTFLISRRLAAQEGQDGQRGTPSPDSTDGSLPLERVDYSVASHRALTDPLRSDPFVIDLNLELDAPDSSSTDSQHRQKLLLPLGWMLPAKAREVMESEIHDRLAPAPALLEATTWDEDWFRRLQQSQLGRVLSLLHRERPTKPVPGEAQGSSRP